GNNSRKHRTVICYNFKGEGHMSKQCTKPKRKKDESWFKDKTDMVIHTSKTEMMKLVVEIKCVGRDADEFDKETGSSDGLQLKQVDLNCIHALNKPHFHEIIVVPSKHEADQHSLCANPLPV
nr:hypothetical protein [Tanacetum cinerariifolium]